MILVVDDDSSVRVSLKLMLERNGYAVELAKTPQGAIDSVRRQAPQLVLLDMNFSRATTGDEGLVLLRQIKIFHPSVPVILMTAWGSIPLAVKGIQSGAFDFITKPWDNALLLQRIATALELVQPETRQDEDSPSAFDRSMIIGRSPALLNVLETVERIAPTDASVLIMGENGTGKELIAEAIHRNSRRAAHPFVKVNLGGIPQSLFESEMFGHKRGAFTGAVADREGRFAMADGGTIFLDEIGELDLNSQVKMLRVLQEHTFEMLGDSNPRRVDLRVVSATNAPLPQMVAEKRFREDLFYRINLITLTLPPLRDRRDDIPLLVDHIASRFCAKQGIVVPEIRRDAIEYLMTLPFNGNIRELKNLVEATILVADGNILGRLEFMAQNAASPTAPAASGSTGFETLEETQRREIETAVARSMGNMSRAAAMLGISRQALYRRIEKFNIKI